MKLKTGFFLLIIVFLLTGCNNQKTSTVQENLSLSNNLQKQTMQKEEKEVINKAVIKTEKGEIEIVLFPDKAPETVKNFADKAKAGYYNGLIFHRVEDWVVQGGDPLGNGTGGGDMKTELNQEPFTIGSVGVARGGNIKISNDSQFFICTKDCGFLTGQYTNFGKVTKGMEIVNQLKIGDKILGIGGF